jgi:hypothetical protein
MHAAILMHIHFLFCFLLPNFSRLISLCITCLHSGSLGYVLTYSSFHLLTYIYLCVSVITVLQYALIYYFSKISHLYVYLSLISRLSILILHKLSCMYVTWLDYTKLKLRISMYAMYCVCVVLCVFVYVCASMYVMHYTIFLTLLVVHYTTINKIIISLCYWSLLPLIVCMTVLILLTMYTLVCLVCTDMMDYYYDYAY